jgi:DNA polymerase III epsilon subunit-like protein
MSLQYLVVDLESNGIKCGYHEVNEISIIRCSDRMQLTEFIKCDYPERSNLDALNITKKTLADLSMGNSKEKVIDKIDKFLNEDGLSSGHRCLIAHNAAFDRRFLHKMYESVGKKLEADLWLCTMALTRAYAKSIGIIKPRVNLHASIELVGIKKFADKHNSKVDSRNTYLLWKDLVENKKVDYLSHIKNLPHTFDDDRATAQDLEDLGLDPLDFE